AGGTCILTAETSSSVVSPEGEA
ncbi:MAG: hypothetical protein RLZZ435_1739, partial [Cyanobacteriota bacterium]